MNKFLLKAGMLTIGSGVLVVSFQNCGPAGFEISHTEKINLLSNTSVMTFASKEGNAAVSSGTVGYIPVDSNGNVISGGVPVNGSGSGSGSGGFPINGGSGSGTGSGFPVSGGSGSGTGSGFPINGGSGSGTGSGFPINGGSGSGTGSGFPINGGSGSGTGSGFPVSDGSGSGTGSGFPVGGGSGSGTGSGFPVGGGSGSGTGSGFPIGGGSGSGTGSGFPVGGGSGSGTGSGFPVGGGSGSGTGSGFPVGGGSGSGTGSGFPVGGGSATDGTTGEFYVESGTDDGNVKFPVEYLCSTNLNPSFTRVVADVNSKIIVVPGRNVSLNNVSTSNAVCVEDQRANILNLKKIVLSTQCRAKLVDKAEYSIFLSDSKGNIQQSGLIMGSTKFVSRTGSLVNSPSSKVPTLTVHFADNPDVRGGRSDDGSDSRVLVEEDICDDQISPLVIAMGQNIRKIDLSAPTDGIKFDIAGKNALPIAHTKKQISWFKRAMADYYFVSLPNTAGVVDSVDQLFGDNTYGPDHKFAANGYAALAKYDDNRDGYITKDDKVWSQLRLWQDKNSDGKGMGAELTGLDRHGIISIDLKFDAKYSEYDKFGNETKMKSVVKMSDGSLNLIFDLWFRPIGN